MVLTTLSIVALLTFILLNCFVDKLPNLSFGLKCEFEVNQYLSEKMKIDIREIRKN